MFSLALPVKHAEVLRIRQELFWRGMGRMHQEKEFFVTRTRRIEVKNIHDTATKWTRALLTQLRPQPPSNPGNYLRIR